MRGLALNLRVYLSLSGPGRTPGTPSRGRLSLHKPEDGLQPLVGPLRNSWIPTWSWYLPGWAGKAGLQVGVHRFLERPVPAAWCSRSPGHQQVQMKSPCGSEQAKPCWQLELPDEAAWPSDRSLFVSSELGTQAEWAWLLAKHAQPSRGLQSVWVWVLFGKFDRRHPRWRAKSWENADLSVSGNLRILLEDRL